MFLTNISLRSLTDKVLVFGTSDGGSIPPGGASLRSALAFRYGSKRRAVHVSFGISFLLDLKASRIMDWYVYIIECADGMLYTGITHDLDRRINEHNTSSKFGSKFVRVRRPVKLVYSERKRTKSNALKKELEIKGWTRDKKIDLIKGADSSKENLILRSII